MPKIKITFEVIIEKFHDFYIKALKNKSIDKPMAWSLYQTWKWVDAREMSRIRRDKNE